ncbi:MULTISPECIES: TonB family protein [unclassified Pseudoalteromonas]|jgi:protein TonB|uniref:TonB family protein n=1 Tax=unclassified Pseudoalteromonas TaxID=194690 RepID=UPI000EC0839B|nr:MULTISPECIES: TonB family protein [unclassified Pseudoalteromonas]HAG38836.1 energy transducer TonB [Pseudoalteromonas sp.]|tara:strand:+ start:1167 stop:1511 length:345 start_codon:yes stop_codon:yes gene_type:complete
MKYLLSIIAALIITGCTTTPLQDSPTATVKSTVPPKYPVAEVRNKTEGFVTMSFDVDSYGRPNNIKVINAKPEQVFNSEAKRALSKWQYSPKVVNGVAVPDKNLEMTIEFNLDN